jgi:hypothetical protein
MTRAAPTKQCRFAESGEMLGLSVAVRVAWVGRTASDADREEG